ncbi:MAG: NYN domain-containing protein [bacterium]|nr:NYN domain-containing protein [bacterium]
MDFVKQKSKVYIDGSNIYHAQKIMGYLIDWKKMKQMIESDNEVSEWRYYVGTKDGDNLMQGFLKYLNHIGMKVVSKPLKRIKILVADTKSGLEEERWIFKANFDVEITADILLGSTNADKVILFTGDSDFVYLANQIKAGGKNVEFYSSKKTIAWEIRKKTGAKISYFEDLNDIIKS